MRKYVGTLAVVFSLTATGLAETTSTASSNDYDLVVYGGTASGVAAAISGAREGLKVALLEPTEHIGGMVTGGLSRTDFGNKKCIGGFPLEFYKKLGEHYGEEITWYPEPHVALDTMNAIIKEADVPVFYKHRLQENDGVTTGDGRIKSITMENGATFSAKVFADCSYEGDLMAKSGVSYTWGREGQDQYGEDLAGVRAKTPKHQFTVQVKARDENGKLKPLIQDVPRGEPGQADKKVQAYNFRLCMTQKEGNKVPFPKPPNYDPADWDLLAYLLEAQMQKNGVATPVKYLMHPPIIQNEKTDTNNNGAISTDYIGGSWNYPDATYAEREKIWDDHYEYVAGFLYFLANDPRVYQATRDEMNTWGLAADEFTDNNNWPRQLYVREGRRMVADYVMTQKDIQGERAKEDVIGMGSYNSDSHNVQRNETPDGFVLNEGDVQVGVKPYQIPYRLITPKKEQVENLLVPVTFSASHIAYSTLRMEPQYMLIGEAAGVAAKLAIEEDKAVQDIDTKALTNKLRERGAVLELEDHP